MQIKLYIFLFVGLLTFLGANSCSMVGIDPNDIESIEMRINHHKQTAVGLGPQMVYLVQEEDEIGGEDWKYLYEEIEGFTYESGYLYDLRVRKINVQNPPQDGSGLKYVLKKVVSRERTGADEKFDIKLKWGGNNFVQNVNDEYSILGEYIIQCEQLCEELSLMLENNEEVTGTFTHLAENRLKLILIQ